MSGTKAGGIKAKQQHIARYGEDYYQRIGEKGGISGTPETRKRKGFGSNRELARTAGLKGGRIGRRGKKKDMV